MALLVRRARRADEEFALEQQRDGPPRHQRPGSRRRRARALGMAVGVVAEGGKFADAVKKHGEPAVVLELIGGGYVDEDVRAVQVLGRIVLVGLLAGGKSDIDLSGILRKRVRIFGTVLRARPL